MSGDSNYIVVSLTDSRFHLYTLPLSSTTQVAAIVDAPVFITNPTTSNIPVAISNNGNIIAAAVPNSRVEIYQLSPEKKLVNIGTIRKENNFGKSISLSSNGFRLAITDEETVYLYEYFNGFWDKMDIKQTMTESSSISSISLNGENGDILCIGQPNFSNEEQIIAG